MKSVYILLALCLSTTLAMAQDDTKTLEGRWDIDMQFEGKTVPSWLEIKHSGHATLIGRFVFAFGSARPVSEIVFKDGLINFSIPRQWEPEGSDMEFTASLLNDELVGSMQYVDGKIYGWKGRKAPELARDSEPEWGKPMDVFNGKDLSGWHAEGENQWVVKEGVLTSPESGVNLISDEKFTDFKAHIEFRYPEGSNSGIYLRGRYEVQIADNKGLPPSDIYFSGVYGFLEPNENTAKSAGEWQTYDITLIGRRVTITANGKTVICDQTIPGITGGALDSKEGEPGPFLIQGDHGPVEFKKFVVTPAK